MNARLFCRTGALAGSDYHIDEEATIGRGEENDITLPPEAISGRHARIFFNDEHDRFVLEDLDSSNGTQLDGAEVDAPVPLKDLHVITFAQKIDFIFQVVEEETAASPPEAQTQFGVAPEPPSSVSEKEESEGIQTQFGDASGALPDLPESQSSSSEQQNEPSDEEADPERTHFGEAPEGLPDLSGEKASPDSAEDASEDDASEVEYPQYGESSGDLPDLSGDEMSSDKGDGSSTEDEERAASDDASSEASDQNEEDDSDSLRTQFGEAPNALPDLSAADPFSEDEADEAAAESSPSSEEEHPATSSQGSTPPEGAPPFELEMTSFRGPEDTHPLPVGTVTIGRSDECDIQVEDPGVSRQHAQFLVESDEVVLKDMDSKNFTFVDEERLTEPTILSPGTEIQFGLQVKAVLRRTSS